MYVKSLPKSTNSINTYGIITNRTENVNYEVETVTFLYFKSSKSHANKLRLRHSNSASTNSWLDIFDLSSPNKNTSSTNSVSITISEYITAPGRVFASPTTTSEQRSSSARYASICATNNWTSQQSGNSSSWPFWPSTTLRNLKVT